MKSRGSRSLLSTLCFLFLFTMLIPVASAQSDGNRRSPQDYVSYLARVERFELVIDEGGSMSRGWESYSSTFTRSSPTARTRRVVDHYETRRVVDHYDTRKVFDHYEKVFVGTKRIIDHFETAYRTKTYREWVPGHYETEHRWVWKPIKVLGITVGYYPARESYQKWISGHIETRTRRVSYRKPVYKTVRVYRKRPVYRSERYPVYRTERYPVYETRRYTAYRNRRYRITNYRERGWGSKEIAITIRGSDGYEGDVTLSVRADGMIDTSLADTVVHVGSKASTILKVSPSISVQESTYTITVTATDGSITDTATYELDLKTEPKPSRKSLLLRSWTSNNRPSQTGQTQVIVDQERPNETKPSRTIQEDTDSSHFNPLYVDFGDDRRTCDVTLREKPNGTIETVAISDYSIYDRNYSEAVLPDIGDLTSSDTQL